MPVPHALDFLYVPSDVLVALDYRPYKFALQPVHHLVRLTHMVVVSAFFGGIGLLDLRLMGVRAALPLRAFAEHALPWLYGTFAVAMITGVMLFFYDPVHVGSHAYFTLKLIMIVLGMINAGVFNRVGFLKAMAAAGPMPNAAKIAGALSLSFWLGAMVCASLNVEAAPKVLLR